MMVFVLPKKQRNVESFGSRKISLSIPRIYKSSSMPSTNKGFKLVEILWLDSEQNAEWAKLEDVLADQGSLECKSVGYLVADKEDRVVLASSISADETYEEQVSHYITIPKASIQSIKELRKK